MTERILLLEDDKYIRELISMKFTLEKLEIEIAQSVNEALDLIKTKSWSVVIVDIMFPTRSGVDIAEYILENKLKVPFIFISAKNRAVFLEEFKESIEKYPKIVSASYIMKPFDLDILIKKIRESIVKYKEEEKEK
jgi:DNA-binding response OmpR family regulator